MITTIGVSYILFNIILLGVGADAKNFPNPHAARCHWKIGGAVLQLREVLLWIVSLVLMCGAPASSCAAPRSARRCGRPPRTRRPPA